MKAGNKIALAGLIITILILLFSFVSGHSEMSRDVDTLNVDVPILEDKVEQNTYSIAIIQNDLGHIKDSIDEIKGILKER